MTNGEKFMAGGIAAGSAAAGLPVAYGIIRNLIPKPLDENDLLHTENGAFVAANGSRVTLRGVNLNDDLFFFVKDGADFCGSNCRIFDVLEERFGRYGARNLIDTYNKNFITAADLKIIKKLGANCVRIPLRYKNLFRKENCKGDIILDRLDDLVAACKKAGLYVIFDLHTAPGFQNNDPACGNGEESVLFSSGKDGFEARNAVVRLWAELAAHYKDEPAVAAYDLLNRPLNRDAEWSEKLETLHKLYRRIYKAIRNVDENHTVIMEAVYTPDTLPSPEKFDNIAYGIYSHFHTDFETDSMIASVNACKGDVPFVVCKIRCDGNWDYSLTSLCDNGISWIIGDYKGISAGTSYLYTGTAESIDFDADNYETMIQKWSEALITKKFEANKEFAATLKPFYGYGAITVESKKKADFKAKFSKKKGVKKAKVEVL